MAIVQHNTSTNGDFTLEEDGVEKGKLQYSWAGISTLIVRHTEVYPAYKHHGNGLSLVEAAVNFARQGNFKIIPKCSFTKEIFAQHEEWKDVLWHG